jgi:multidrug resistance protein, MATE family
MRPNLVEAVSMTQPITVIRLLGLGMNVGANYVFMNGHFGVPAMGVMGRGVPKTV